MAKKVIATLTKGASSKVTKLIQVRKSEKTGAYTFRSRIVLSEMLRQTLSAEV